MVHGYKAACKALSARWLGNTPDVSAFMRLYRVSCSLSKMLFKKKGKPRFTFASGHPCARTEANCGTETLPRFTGLRRPMVRELCTTSKAMQYDGSRSEITKPGHRKLLFDTQALVRLLEDSGFTIQQAKVFVNMLVNTTNSNMDIMYNDMVTKTQQEIMLQKVMSHIAAVKKDMIILEKSEFSTLLAENERIKVELAQLNMQLSDMMNKVCLDNKLDVNLEKSQVKEMKAEHERKLLQTRHDVMEMMAEQDRHVTQNNMKIDTEVAGLKTMLESHKLDSIKYLAGSVFTCLTVVLGFYRIWM
ncbi:mitochondrial calcium uniporter regulator 1 isoform X1 [Electrophorus electricus]|uniref:mitochondrial calcium uniporter regulator 1 isoform X1 n=2 Tax=Electrophorus electricus TaxID=8005 RepID=UPI0015D09908|nr:mitochondrial calcium uniporter regulator 1 isoform X1 [Electrophorus electricus]